MTTLNTLIKELLVKKLVPFVLIRNDKSEEIPYIMAVSKLVFSTLNTLIHPDKYEKTIKDDSIFFRVNAKKIAASTGQKTECVQAILLAFYQQVKKSLSLEQISTQRYQLEEINQLFTESIDEYRNYIPPLLQTKVNEEDEQLTRLIRLAVEEKKTVKLFEKNSSNIDMVIETSNEVFKLPAGVIYYLNNGWIPPANFVNAIMAGDIFGLNVQKCRGEGAFIDRLPVTEAVLKQITRNTLYNTPTSHFIKLQSQCATGPTHEIFS